MRRGVFREAAERPSTSAGVGQRKQASLLPGPGLWEIQATWPFKPMPCLLGVLSVSPRSLGSCVQLSNNLQAAPGICVVSLSLPALIWGHLGSPEIPEGSRPLSPLLLEEAPAGSISPPGCWPLRPSHIAYGLFLIFVT